MCLLSWQNFISISVKKIAMGAIGCSTISELVVLKVLIGNSPFDTCGVMMLGIPNVLRFSPYLSFVPTIDLLTKRKING